MLLSKLMPAPQKPLVLVGMPASGKTTIGRFLAARKGVPFYDTDEMVTLLTGQTPAQLFAELGEAFFREKEREALQIALDMGRAVIASGGGLPCYADNMELILNRAHSVYLSVPVPVLQQRIAAQGAGRPLFAGLSKAKLNKALKALWELRHPVYSLAQATHFNAGPSPQSVDLIWKGYQMSLLAF